MCIQSSHSPWRAEGDPRDVPPATPPSCGTPGDLEGGPPACCSWSGSSCGCRADGNQKTWQDLISPFRRGECSPAPPSSPVQDRCNCSESALLLFSPAVDSIDSKRYQYKGQEGDDDDDRFSQTFRATDLKEKVRGISSSLSSPGDWPPSLSHGCTRERCSCLSIRRYGIVGEYRNGEAQNRA